MPDHIINSRIDLNQCKRTCAERLRKIINFVSIDMKYGEFSMICAI